MAIVTRVGPADRPSSPELWARLREICAALPETSDKMSHGEVAWSVAVSYTHLTLPTSDLV